MDAEKALRSYTPDNRPKRQVIITIVQNLQQLYPTACQRHWYLWVSQTALPHLQFFSSSASSRLTIVPRLLRRRLYGDRRSTRPDQLHVGICPDSDGYQYCPI
jgi:hypothetical protein